MEPHRLDSRVSVYLGELNSRKLMVVLPKVPAFLCVLMSFR